MDNDLNLNRHIGENLNDELKFLQLRITELENIQSRHKFSDELLRQVELQQKAILNNIPDIAWLKDRESRFIAVNEAFAKACGLRPQDLVGKTDLDIWPRDLAQKYRADDLEVICSGKRRCIEESLVDNNGLLRQIETIKTPVYNDKNEIIGTTGIARDITERKRYEDNLRQTRAELGIRVKVRTAELTRVNEELRQEVKERRKLSETIKEGEAFLSNVFSSIQDGISVLDKEMNIVQVNPVMEKWYAHNAPLVGKKCYEAYHCRSQPCLDCPTRTTLDTQKAAYQLVPKTSAGGQVIGWLDLYSFPMFDQASGKLVGAIEYVRDITDKKTVEERAGRLNKELLESNLRLRKLSLRDSQTGLYNYRYLEEVIEAEFQRAKRYPHPLSVIMLDIDYFKSINDVYGHQFGDLVLKQLARQLKMIFRRYDVIIRFGGEEFLVISPGADIVSALNLGQRILEIINRYNFGDKKQKVKLNVTLAVVSYPQDKSTNGMGLVNLANQVLDKAKESGGNRVYSSLDIIKHRSPLTLGKKKSTEVRFLQGKIDKLTIRSNQNITEAIFAFAKAIELKDHYTGEHVEDTVHYVQEICDKLALPKDQTALIKQGAALHDLGKIGISEKILLKKSKLTRGEFEEIKKHPQIGADILRPIKFLHNLIPLVFYHHEKWDGTGYPSGIKKEEIPIGARIISVADAYQALTSDRPYRKAYSKEKAIKILRAGSGSQFDPRIIVIFLKILQDRSPKTRK